MVYSRPPNVEKIKQSWIHFQIVCRTYISATLYRAHCMCIARSVDISEHHWNLWLEISVGNFKTTIQFKKYSSSPTMSALWGIDHGSGHMTFKIMILVYSSFKWVMNNWEKLGSWKRGSLLSMHGCSFGTDERFICRLFFAEEEPGSILTHRNLKLAKGRKETKWKNEAAYQLCKFFWGGTWH